MKNRFNKSNPAQRNPRQLKVGEEIKHALANELQRGDYPWPPDAPRCIITVTEVRISPDLRNATAYVVPLGGGDAGAIAAILKPLTYHFKKTIARNVQMKFVPNLFFEADTSFAYADKIEKILHDPNVARDLTPDDD